MQGATAARDAHRPWTDAEHTTLRDCLLSGGSMRDAATLLGRSHASVSRRATTAGLRDFTMLRVAEQDAIRLYAKRGWQPSRIAVRLRLPVEAVNYWSTK